MKKTSPKKLAKLMNISPARGLEAEIKAKLIAAAIKAVNKSGVTHAELSRKCGVPRSAITGILSGSLQKVTLDRVLRILESLELTADVVIRKAA